MLLLCQYGIEPVRHSLLDNSHLTAVKSASTAAALRSGLVRTKKGSGHGNKTAAGSIGTTVPCDPLTAIDKVSKAIQEGIRSGRFVPGQHLVESDIAQKLGISRGSFREAMKRLAVEGTITLVRNRGAYITKLNRKSVEDLLDVLEQLNCLAVTKAALNCDTPAKSRQIKDAASAVARFQEGSDPGLFTALRQNFYDVLFEVGGNQELARVTPLSRADLFRAQIRPFLSAQEHRKRVDGYSAISDAVIGRDPAKAEHAIRRYFSRTRAMVADLPPVAFGEPG